ncbi:MAG: DUF1641 domain-containing protein [Proteobacteria bacterium]|nr:DUF1641 domain-containing protein [Pseudomonadota bacterium]
MTPQKTRRDSKSPGDGAGNGAGTSGGPSAGLDARLGRIESSLERISTLLETRVAPLIDQAPALVATVTDIADEVVDRAAQRGVAVDQWVREGAHLLTEITEPANMAALGRLAGHTGAAADAATAAPGAIAAAVDTFDEALARAAERGIDVEAAVSAAIDVVGRLARMLAAPEMQSIIDLLTPQSAAAAAALRDALNETREEPGGRAGILALFRATRDPEVQQALDFGIRLLKRLGRLMAESQRTTR